MRRNLLRRRPAFEVMEDRLVLSCTMLVDTQQRIGDSSGLNAGLGDLDGDGDLDAFLGRQESNEVWLNQGKGEFRDTGQHLGETRTDDVALGDLDGDGDLDAFVANDSRGATRGNLVWLNDGSAQFVESGQRLGEAESRSVALGDVDGDGDLDALTADLHMANKLWLNDGQGSFRDSGHEFAASPTVAVSLDDLDSDGDLDAFIANAFFAARTSSTEVWLNDGRGQFQLSDRPMPVYKGSVSNLAFADVDGDATLDAVLGGFGTAAEIWLNSGAGEFRDSGQRLLGEAAGISRVAVGDMDGDGNLDVIIIDINVSRVWLNDGKGTFRRGQRLSTFAWSMSLGDLTGDGDVDVFQAGLKPRQVWLNSIPGDANRDGRFDQTDLIDVLQVGKYLTGQAATWSEGDWNSDGVFDQLDIVFALQCGDFG